MATIEDGAAADGTIVNLADDGLQQFAVQADWHGGVAAAFMGCGIGSAAFGAHGSRRRSQRTDQARTGPPARRRSAVR